MKKNENKFKVGATYYMIWDDVVMPCEISTSVSLKTLQKRWCQESEYSAYSRHHTKEECAEKHYKHWSDAQVPDLYPTIDMVRVKYYYVTASSNKKCIVGWNAICLKKILMIF